MKLVILFASFAFACALPAPRAEDFEPGEKAAFIAVLDFLRTLTIVAADVDPELNRDGDKDGIVNVIEKIKWATDAGNWDLLDIQEDEEPAFLAVLKTIEELGKAFDNIGAQELPRAARRVRSLQQYY